MTSLSHPLIQYYLGNDLEDVRGRTILEENSVVTMPLLLLPGVVLVPGQVIPLQLYQQRLVAMVRRVADKDKTFGVVNMGKSFDDDDRQKSSSLGCTAEIFSMKEEMDEQSGISTVRVKARGRQRFRIEEIKHEITGDVMARVRILPEISLCHALDGARLPSHYKIMVSPPDDSDDMIKTAVDRQGRAFASVDLRRKSLVTKLYSANYTWWPPWVYKMYDIEWLAEQTRAELHSWCPTSLPDDPVDLSFWVAHNLPIDDELRLRLLQFDSVVQRLRFGLSIIRKTDVLLCCHSCHEKIASKNDVFGMSQEGPLGSYVNPGGYVHEMFTVTAVQNLNTSGRSSTEFSWFPGYAWTIINCKQCYSHMGWMFTATEKSLSPRKFWGLCRSSIKTNFSTLESETDSEENKLFIM
ncbi:protein cereblon-like isoform X2 [Physella acuta]|uniref:protein cereblon-like isoform X2 n=1 Tax=Physella acuta TaxID=109671 RepID=UPI0027DDF77E|nr:protein cereblon-like isoform X2 [Physella acuta]